MRLVIRGRVQRVGYRVSLDAQARARGVRGWVRNREDGAVEAVLQGAEDAVHAVSEWAWSGPRGASVHDVSATEEPITESFADFEIRA
jgi:acylphosphatase